MKNNSKVKNILFLDQFGDRIGGGQIILLDILAYFKTKSEYNVYVVIPKKGIFTDRLEKLGIDYWVIPTGTHDNSKNQILDGIEYVFSSLKSSLTLKQKVEEHKIDTIYCNGGRTFLSAAIVSLLKSVRIIWHLHLILKGPQKILVNLFGRLNSVQQIVAVSNRVKNDYQNSAIYNKISVIYNWVSPVFLEENKKEKINNNYLNAIIVGLISPEKGQMTILDELEKCNLPLNLELTIVGSPITEEYGKIIKDKISRLKNRGWKINLPGFQRDIRSLIDQQDLLIIPSLVEESFGLTAIEAMARNVLVLANKSGALSEIIKTGHNGFLYQINKKGDFVNKIDNLIKENKSMDNIKKVARKEVEIKYTPEKQLKKVEQLVNKSGSKIYIDSRLVNGSGIGTYLKNLIRFYDNFDLPAKIELLVDQNNPFSQDNSFEQINYNSQIYSIKEQLQPLKKLIPGNIFHAPHYNAPLLYPGKLVVTVHDICHVRMKEFFPGLAKKVYSHLFLRLVLLRANKIITVSNFSKQEIMNYFNIPENKIKVIHNGINEDFKKSTKEEVNEIKKKYNLPENYLLYLGNVRPHKNIKGLFESYQIALNKKPDLPKLVLVGEEEALKRDDLKLFNTIKNSSISDRIIFTGYLPYEDLAAIYTGAKLFLFLSLYEGFGFPPLEAMACGTPVICSNSSSLPEVVGESAVSVNPRDYKQIANSIIELLENEILQRQLIEKGYKQIKKFTWEKSAEEHLKVYNDL